MVICRYCKQIEPKADMRDVDDGYGSDYFHLDCWQKQMSEPESTRIKGWKSFFGSYPNPFESQPIEEDK